MEVAWAPAGFFSRDRQTKRVVKIIRGSGRHPFRGEPRWSLGVLPPEADNIF